MKLFPYMCCAATLGGFAVAAHADVWDDLVRSARAGQTLNITGQYVRQTEKGITTYTVYRLHRNSLMTERRIAADGTPREILKTRNTVHFLTQSPHDLPQVKMDGIRFFPAALPLNTKVLKETYTAEEYALGRVAGRTCRWIRLIPKNPARYTQDLCIDKSRYLPLTQIYRSPQGIAETNTFAHISYTRPDKVQMRADNRLNITDSMRLLPETDRRYFDNAPLRDEHLDGLPEGLRIFESRALHRRNGHHYVLGDGLVKVSLFIEPSTQRNTRPLTISHLNGALSAAFLTTPDYKLTAIGDLPPQGLADLLLKITIR